MKDLNKKIIAILSITSHSYRLKYIDKVLLPIIKTYYNQIHIVLTIYIDDYKYITPVIFNLIQTGKIELFVSPINLHSHLKYFYTMTRYKNIPIITLDDDNIYPVNFIYELLDYSNKYKNRIICRKAAQIIFNKTNIQPYVNWNFNTKIQDDSYLLFALGTAGVLYPPNVFNLTNANITEIQNKCVVDDDVYLKVLSIRNKIKTYCINCDKLFEREITENNMQDIALWKSCVPRIDNVIKQFKQDFDNILIY